MAHHRQAASSRGAMCRQQCNGIKLKRTFRCQRNIRCGGKFKDAPAITKEQPAPFMHRVAPGISQNRIQHPT